jgi:integral membrane protein
MNNIFGAFRKIAIAEGISFLVLLFIAMPLKYWANKPQFVQIIGSAHGLLFVLFILFAGIVLLKYKKNIGWFAKAVVASFLPFGTFYMDKQWKLEEQTISMSL